MPSPRRLIDPLFLAAAKGNASDVHLIAGLRPTMRVDGELIPFGQTKPLKGEDIEALIEGMLLKEAFAEFLDVHEKDLGYQTPDGTRFRVNLYWEKGAPALAARLIPAEIPTMEALGSPEVLFQFTELSQGLVLVTGPTGCGKSTTLAAMIQHINQTRSENIITLEDPIEFLYTPDKSLISQRQLGTDMHTFAAGMKHILRQDPNVILVGEMRDPETIATTITLAETGHLVFATLHTNSAAQTIDRIIDVFPPHQQSQIRLQLSLVLQGVVSQLLLPKVGGGRIAAREILVQTTAIANLIREAKTAQVGAYLQTNKAFGMQTLDQDLQRLLQEGLIDQETASFYARNPKMFA